MFYAEVTFILRKFIDVLLPFVTQTINTSLLQGRLPDSQKHANAMPLLKKSGLDTADMNNDHPVSYLFFKSKLIERVVANELNEYEDDDATSHGERQLPRTMYYR